MKVEDFARKLNMKVLTGDTGLDRDITSIYAGDLLSWVMSHAGKGDAWITVHTHLNVVAVASLTDAACVVIPESIEVEEATLNKAVQEGVVILGTEKSTYEICWRAHGIL